MNELKTFIRFLSPFIFIIFVLGVGIVFLLAISLAFIEFGFS
jgi:hypothetical protein